MKRGGKIAALILAAGFSSRMGAFKPLLPLGDATPLELQIRRFHEAGIEDVRVVTGHMAGQLRPVLAALGAGMIFNADYRRGMLSSVQAGIRSLGRETGAFFILPVDIPLVKPQTMKALTSAFMETGAQILYPRFLGRRGHPPLISTVLPFHEIDPDMPGGMKAFLEGHDKAALDVDVTDQGITLDFDTPEDYRRLCAYAAGEEIPTKAECRAFLIRFGVPGNVVTHSRVVAELARTIAVHLNLAGAHLDINAVVAGGLLHDLARGRPGHAAAGAAILRKFGYPKVAEIVENHMELRGEGQVLRESDLVYLADKLVAEDRLVSLAERYAGACGRFAGDPAALDAAAGRMRAAERITERVEEYCGTPVEQIIEKWRKAILGAAFEEKKTIYLVRHGTIASPGTGRHFIGRTDLPLNAEGARQAEMLRERFRDVPLSAVFCSDLDRSLETARIIAEPHGLAPTVRRELREIDLGEWDGLAFDEVRRRFPGQFEERGRDIVHFRPPGGESFLDCTMRVLPVFHELIHSAHAHAVIVGHAGVNRIILCQVLGMSLDRLFELRQDYACINLIHRDESGLALEVLDEDGTCDESPQPSQTAHDPRAVPFPEGTR